MGAGICACAPERAGKAVCGLCAQELPRYSKHAIFGSKFARDEQRRARLGGETIGEVVAERIGCEDWVGCRGTAFLEFLDEDGVPALPEAQMCVDLEDVVLVAVEGFGRGARWTGPRRVAGRNAVPPHLSPPSS